ncbi:MAG: HAD-IA family hydrolase [Myxococcales bacterium]|nr:HAD-IA family hydrolase [Myxococcales bacterium]
MDALAGAFGAEGLVRQLVVGDASPQDLSAWLATRFGAQVDEDDVIAAFADDVSERMPGIEPLVSALQDRYRLSILSNTFFGHWHQVLHDPFYRVFERPMASHLLRAAKPDPVIYQRALEQLGCPPDQVAFIDDKQENTDAARAAGMHAIHSTSVDQTRTGLVALGCLD